MTFAPEYCIKNSFKLKTCTKLHRLDTYNIPYYRNMQHFHLNILTRNIQAIQNDNIFTNIICILLIYTCIILYFP